MQQERHQVVSLVTATPPFALFRAQEECVYTWTSDRPSGDMIAPSCVRPRLLTSHVTEAPAPPAGIDHVPLITLPHPAHRGPRVPPGFDQSRNALPDEHLTRPQLEYPQKGKTYNSFEERNTYPIFNS